jgi:hypothetical protein
MIPNWLAYFVTVVVMIVLGLIWYGPLFGKEWMRLLGIDPHREEIRKKWAVSMAVQIIGALLMVFVLDRAISVGGLSEGITGIAAGFHFAFWNWIGFVAPVTVGMVLWEGKSWKYWWIVAGYWFIALIVSGCILALWQ